MLQVSLHCRIVRIYLSILFLAMVALLNDPVYISIANAKTNSVVLNWFSDAIVWTAITEAQFTIDTYIGFYGTKKVDTQRFIFPTVENNNSTPDEIQVATVRIAEQLVLQGMNLNSISGKKITSEWNLSRNVSFSDKESFQKSVETVNIPKKALNILDKYRNNFIWMVI